MAGNTRSAAFRRLAKPWIVMPVVGALIVAGWWVVRGRDGDGEAAATPAESVVEVTTGPMALTVSAEGTLEAAQTDDLSFGAAGTVTAVAVEAGDEVHEGDALAIIDSPSLELAVADAEATLADAQSQLSDDQDADATDAQLAADESSVTAAQNSLDAANEDLAGSWLVATFDGTVSQVNVAVGDELADGGTGGSDATGSDSGSGASSSTLGATSAAQPDLGGGTDTASTSSPDIQVVDTTHFTVDLGFDQSDVENLAVGQEATAAVTTSTSSSGLGIPAELAQAFGGGGGAFPGATTDTTEGEAGSADTPTDPTADAASGPEATGIVWEVGRVADASSGVASYPVTVLFEDESGDFNAGATVSVDITYDQREDVVQVSSLAVTTTDGESTVTVRSADGSDEVRTVTTGLRQGSTVEITEGLAAGEQVVVSIPTFGGGGDGGDLPTGGGGGFTPPDGAPTGAVPNGG